MFLLCVVRCARGEGSGPPRVGAFAMPPAGSSYGPDTGLGMDPTSDETATRREAARHGDGTFGPHPAEDSGAALVGAEILSPVDDAAQPPASDSEPPQEHAREPQPPEPDAGERLAAAILSEAASEIRAARTQRVRSGTTKWLRRAQILTALGTLSPARVGQAWRDMRRDTAMRYGQIRAETYWQEVADDACRNPEFFDPRAAQKPEGGYVSVWPDRR